MADSDDERIYSVAAGKNKMTPWDRIRAGAVANQHFLLPLAFVSGIGVVQILVPWWIVWPILAVAGALYWKNRQVRVKAQADVKERSQQELEEELLREEKQSEKEKEAARAARLQKEREIAARIEAELLAGEAPSRGAAGKNKKGPASSGSKGAASGKKGAAAASSGPAADAADDDEEDAYFMAQMIKGVGSKKGLGQGIDMKDVIAASEGGSAPSAGAASSTTSAQPSRKAGPLATDSDEGVAAVAAPASSGGGRRRQNRAKADGNWQQS